MIFRFFLIAILFHTPFNFTGVLPPYLYIFCLSALAIIIQYKSYNIDINLLIATSLLYSYSIATALLNHSHINSNYTVAWGVVLFGYLLLSSVALQQMRRDDVDKTLALTFKIFIFISFIDYIFHQFFIPLHDIIPMELRNKSVATGLFYRVPGFYEEPTNWAGLGIGLCIYYIWSSEESAKTKAIYVALFLLVLVMTRSAIAIGAFIAVLVFQLFIGLLISRLRDTLMKIALFCFTIWFIVSNIELFKLGSVVAKISLNSNVSSVSGRLGGWSAVYNGWLSGTPVQQIFGRGLGYAEFNLGSVHSWFLTLLTEQGLFGLIIVLLLIVVGVSKSISVNFYNNQAIILSFMSQFLMLLSNSQFYHPFFWVLLSMMYSRRMCHPTRY